MITTTAVQLVSNRPLQQAAALPRSLARHTARHQGMGGPRGATSRKDCVTVDLARLLSMAAGLNRDAAEQYGVRVQGDSSGHAVAGIDVGATLKRFAVLLKRAIQSAHRGTVVTGQARIRTGAVELHLRYARPMPSNLAQASGFDWIDELWSWQPAKVATLAH